MKRRETGILGENLACDFLGKNGYRIIETNYRCQDGEIDIIAQQQDTLVFVEVRTKKSSRFGTPEESITPNKKSKLRTVAAHYGQNRNDLPVNRRIDVVAIQMDERGKVSRIELIENAVEEMS
ncbi:MAG: YraN family protein [Dehalococcoidales bacterium]|nr:YraN family protein [Dehalococcoidales bacterium]